MSPSDDAVENGVKVPPEPTRNDCNPPGLFSFVAYTTLELVKWGVIQVGVGLHAVWPV